MIRVHVTQEHIIRGQSQIGYVLRAFSCPIALALKDAGFFSPAVAGGLARFGSGNRERITLSPKVEKFIANADYKMDSTDGLLPFSFLVGTEEEAYDYRARFEK